MINALKKCALAALIASLLLTAAPSLVTRVRAADIPDPNVASKSAILIDAQTGVVLYEKDAHEQLYPASVTKIMTALLLIEYLNSEYGEITDEVYAKRIPFSEYAVYSIEPGSSSVYMQPGETLTIKDALRALVMRSANEVAAAIAEYVSGTEAAFAEKMTERAAELGCEDTHFVNAHGLDDPNHYTTSRDLALIMREAVKHKEFTDAISTVFYTVPPTEKTAETRYWENQNKMILKDSGYYYEYAVGGKTGYTDTARHTYVAYAEKDGMKLIVAIMDAEGYDCYTDAKALMEYGFQRFTQTDLLTGDNGYELNIPGADGPIKASPESGLSALLPDAADLTKIVKTPVSDDGLSLPIAKGDEVGLLSVSYDGYVLGSVGLVADEPAPPQNKNDLAPAFGDDAAVPASASKDSPAQTSGANEKNKALFSAELIVLALAAVFAIIIIVKTISDKKNAGREKYRFNKGLMK